MQIGVPLEEVTTFGKFLGGSAANVAVAGAPRYGHSSTLITRTGNDPSGVSSSGCWATELGVSTEHVGTDKWLPTPVTFCEIFPPDDFPLYFYRYPQAPDRRIEIDDLPLAEIVEARVYWATLTGLSAEPSRQSCTRPPGSCGPVVHTPSSTWITVRTSGPTRPKPPWWRNARSPNARWPSATVRCAGWGWRRPSRSGPRPRCWSAGSNWRSGSRPPRVLAMTADEEVEVPPVMVEVINGLGAGDAEGGAVCHGLLQGRDLRRLLSFANAAGALVASRLECSTGDADLEAEVFELKLRSLMGSGAFSDLTRRRLRLPGAVAQAWATHARGA